MEMKRFNGKAKADDQGAVAGAGPGKGPRACQSPCGLGLGDAFQLPKQDLEGVVRSFRAPTGEYNSKDAWRSRFRPFRPSCQDPSGSCLLLRIVLQDASSEVTQIYPPVKLRVFEDDITALSRERNRDKAEIAKKVMKKLKEEVEKKGLKLSVTENGKEEKSKKIASCGFLENELHQFRREEGVALAEAWRLWASTREREWKGWE